LPNRHIAKGEKKMTNEDLKAFFKSLPGIIIVLVVVMALLWGATYLLTLGERPLINLHRENIQSSQQYTEAQVQRLQNLYTEYNSLGVKIAEAGENSALVDALKAQQKALVSQMETIADLIPESEVPQDIRTFLATH